MSEKSCKRLKVIALHRKGMVVMMEEAEEASLLSLMYCGCY